MITNKTLLSKRDLEFLEKIIARYGSIVASDQLKFFLTDYSRDELNQRIKFLVKRGWLVRIKRGYYAVSGLESRSFTNMSPFVISQILVPDSYVSFEFALNYHGYFDQLINQITAVTPLKSKIYHFQDLEYRFVRAKPEMMTGSEEQAIEGQKANVAILEKTLIDFLHFRKDIYTASLVLEKLKDAKDAIDPDLLAKLLKPFPVAVKRRMGFLFDLAGIESSGIYFQIKKTAEVAKFTKNSNIFNAKWRIYYEEKLTK